jgi:hypothetical protein
MGNNRPEIRVLRVPRRKAILGTTGEQVKKLLMGNEAIALGALRAGV